MCLYEIIQRVVDGASFRVFVICPTFEIRGRPPIRTKNTPPGTNKKQETGRFETGCICCEKIANKQCRHCVDLL